MAIWLCGYVNPGLNTLATAQRAVIFVENGITAWFAAQRAAISQPGTDAGPLGRGALLPFFYKDFGHYGPMPWQTGNNWGRLSGF